MVEKTVKIGSTVLGQGRPKIAVPITGKTTDEIIEQAQQILKKDPDLVEWRIDFFNKIAHKDDLKQAASQLRKTLGDTPLLTTFRTKAEGGNLLLADEDYFEICHVVIDLGLTDAIDVELFHDQSEIDKILKQARAKDIKTIMSSHDFSKTPSQDEIVDRLSKMDDRGGDVAKIAVMPKNNLDVLTLLKATAVANEKLDCPIISMSMGDLGKVSRISGEVFGSVLSFATVGEASAPGQIPIDDLRRDLENLGL